MRQASGDAFAYHLPNQRMQPQRRGHQMPYFWKASSRFRRQPRDVLRPMPAGREEVREYHHRLGALLNAGSESLGDGGLGKFHVRRLDDSYAACRTKHLHHCQQELVAFVPPRSVVNHHYTYWRRATFD